MELLRTVEFFPGNMFQFSVMVRTGIFISIRVVLKVTSLHIPDFLFIWATAALLKMLNALSFRVGTDFPVSSVPYFLLWKSVESFVACLGLWINIFVYSLGLGPQGILMASFQIQPLYAGRPCPWLPKKCLALAICFHLDFSILKE